MTALGAALPFVWTPPPVIALPRETLYSYIEGGDPLTGKRVIDEILDALTKTPGEGGGETGPLPLMHEEHASREEMVAPDTEDNLQRLFWERGWTAGLPVILPTPERVAHMLTGTGRPRDELVGEIFNHDTKEMIRYTVGDIAVVAVMAGARPEHLPVILATAACKQSALTPSTTPFGSMLLINGPIAREIGMNSGIAAFSPANLANAVIGRAWTLMSICWGYARPKVTLWSSQGNNFLYNNMCFAENEERSVWTPFHVTKGFGAEESVVSVFKGWYVMSSLQAAVTRTAGEEITLQLSVIPGLRSNATLLLDPLVAKQLKEMDGFETKQDFARWISQNALIPNGRFWGTDTIDMLVAPLAGAGVEPYASWKKLPADALIPHYHDPEAINIVVVGGETSPVWKTTDYACWASAPVDYWRPGAA